MSKKRCLSVSPIREALPDQKELPVLFLWHGDRVRLKGATNGDTYALSTVTEMHRPLIGNKRVFYKGEMIRVDGLGGVAVDRLERVADKTGKSSFCIPQSWTLGGFR